MKGPGIDGKGSVDLPSQDHVARLHISERNAWSVHGKRARFQCLEHKEEEKQAQNLGLAVQAAPR